MNKISNQIFSCIMWLSLAQLALGIVFLPNLFEKMPTAHKVVCHSRKSLINNAPVHLFCKDEAKLKIFESKSGLQNKEACFEFEESNVLIENGCEEESETTRLLKEKCDGKNLCTIDMTEPFPNNCPDNTHSFLNISYSCVPKHVPYKEFARARFGNASLLKNRRQNLQTNFKSNLQNHQNRNKIRRPKKTLSVNDMFKAKNNFRRS